jgi:hypothetical protein
LSIASTWYRTWASARYHHKTTTNWIDTWIHPQRRIHQHQAAAAIINTSTTQRYVSTLDLSKAFDHLDPEVALATLTHLGMTQTTATFLNIWTRQARYLTYHNQITKTPTHVNSSIPQGDSWSMLALTAVMQSPLRDINQRWPQSQHAVYVDDRTFTTTTIPQLQAITNYWHSYITTIGMTENPDKAQYWTDGPESRRQELANHMGYHYDPTKHDHITFLGITLAPTGTHSTSYNEAQLQRRQKKPIAPPPAVAAATHSTTPKAKSKAKARTGASNTTSTAKAKAKPRARQTPTPTTLHSHGGAHPATASTTTSALNGTPTNNTQQRPQRRHFTARDENNLYPTEATRLQAAQRTLQRIQRLPHAWHHKARFIGTAAIPKAAYGWMHHLPSQKACKNLRVDAYQALGTPPSADRALSRLLAGHNTDMAFMSGSCVTSAYNKHNTTTTTTTTTPLAQTVANWLQNQGWQPTTHTDQWRHPLTGHTITGPAHSLTTTNQTATRRRQPHNLFTHNLREAWRATQHDSWARSDRNDAQAAQLPAYNSTRLNKAKIMARKSAHHFAILTGASVSSARPGKIKLPQWTTENLDNNDPRIRCTRCQECGTHDHQMWGCPGNPFNFTAPHEPFQRRLGWPTSNNEEYNNVVLDHMARTRQQLLAQRYDQAALPGDS